MQLSMSSVTNNNDRYQYVYVPMNNSVLGGGSCFLWSLLPQLSIYTNAGLSLDIQWSSAFIPAVVNIAKVGTHDKEM